MQSNAPDDAPAPQLGKSVSWTSFDASEGSTVTVLVALNQSSPWQDCLVRPLSLGAEVERTEEGQVSFSLVSPFQVMRHTRPRVVCPYSLA